MTRAGCAVLAAGASRRLGRPKQLVPFRGGTLLGHVLAQARASRCERVAVILGAHAAEVRPTIEARASGGQECEAVDVLLNEAWEEGVASSVRAAARWAVAAGLDLLVLVLGDQPGLTAAHVDQLLDASRATAPPGLAASEYEGVLAVPAVFPSRLFEALLALRGDRGAASLLRGERGEHGEGVAAIPWPLGDLDVDDEAGIAHLRAFETTLGGPRQPTAMAIGPDDD